MADILPVLVVTSAGYMEAKSSRKGKSAVSSKKGVDTSKAKDTTTCSQDRESTQVCNTLDQVNLRVLLKQAFEDLGLEPVPTSRPGVLQSLNPQSQEMSKTSHDVATNPFPPATINK